MFANRLLMLFRLTLISLLVLSQTANLSHAAAHSDEQDNHNCIICDADILSHKDQVILPPSAIVNIILDPLAAHADPVISNTVYAWPPERGPPPRSPPITH